MRSARLILVALALAAGGCTNVYTLGGSLASSTEQELGACEATGKTREECCNDHLLDSCPAPPDPAAGLSYGYFLLATSRGR